MKRLIAVGIWAILPVFIGGVTDAQEGTGYRDFLKLGTAQGYGGEDWLRYERSQIKHQIKQGIPPNLQPAFAGDAYTLPPNAFRIGLSGRFARIGGDDFYDDNEVEPIDLTDRVVTRQFGDLDFLYGFDLNRRFLHSFTLRVNIPVLGSRVGGQAYPEGFKPGMTVLGDGATQDVGDIGIFLKKKLQDQANFPVGVALMGGFTIPMGSNARKFANDGKGVQVRMPDMSCMFPGRDFTTSPLTSADFAPMLGMAMPAMPCGMKVGQFPFPLSPDNVFDRFSPDGRLPALMQPGLGAVSYTAGLFFTRQFLQGDWGPLDSVLGRSAAHLGATHQFVSKHDGIDPGDTTTFFASFVKPLFKDYLSLDTTFLGKRQETDHYDGQIIHPFPTPGVCGGGPCVTFRRIDRPPFQGGISGYIAPSLIFSPDPQIRLTATGMFRVKTPELGPAPAFISRLAMEVTF
ncbi:MAG: hypothetical protein HY921_10490 [Elusimicrobia bacterium]|nr:hypothetical protein [Elusimicrobiota bacterium]